MANQINQNHEINGKQGNIINRSRCCEVAGTGGERDSGLKASAKREQK